MHVGGTVRGTQTLPKLAYPQASKFPYPQRQIGNAPMLTELVLRGARPAEKPQKLYDERGLYLLVLPTGARHWRLKYRYRGKEKLLALGRYPEVSLKRARDLCDEA